MLIKDVPSHKHTCQRCGDIGIKISITSIETWIVAGGSGFKVFTTLLIPTTEWLVHIPTVVLKHNKL